MKGTERKHRRKLDHLDKKFELKKNAIMQTQLDTGIFFGKELNDKLIYHLSNNKVYSILNNKRQLASKLNRRVSK